MPEDPIQPEVGPEPSAPTALPSPAVPTPPAPAPLPAGSPPFPPAQLLLARPKTVYINYFDGINESKVKALMALCSDIIAKCRPETLYFLVSSNGGSVNAGIALYNFLRALPVEIVMHNTGSIDSIATVIFLAGNRRYAALHSTFLFHGVQMTCNQGVVLNYTQLQEHVSMMQQDENKIAGIIAARTQLTEAEIRQLFRQGESKDLAFAKEKGIIHEAKDAAIPKDAPFMTVNLN